MTLAEKQTMSEELDVMGGRSWASTPLDVVMENPIAVSNDKSILLPIIQKNLQVDLPLAPPLLRLQPLTHLPRVPLDWAGLSIVSQVHDKPLFEKR